MEIDVDDILIIIIIIGCLIAFNIFIYFTSRTIDEKDCLSYYKENNYILNGCEVYREKLEASK